MSNKQSFTIANQERIEKMEKIKALKSLIHDGNQIKAELGKLNKYLDKRDD